MGGKGSVHTEGEAECDPLCRVLWDSWALAGLVILYQKHVVLAISQGPRLRGAQSNHVLGVKGDS